MTLHLRLHPVPQQAPSARNGADLIRAFDAQTAVWRSGALIALTAAVCEALIGEYDSGQKQPIRPGREIEENKWSAQRYGLGGAFVDHDSHESAPTREFLSGRIDDLETRTKRDLSGVERILREPTEADRQLEVWRETGSVFEVARDVAARTSAEVA